MTVLERWQLKWGLSGVAIEELAHALAEHAVRCAEAVDDGVSESIVQANVRLEASTLGIHLFRNNVGAGKLENGNFIRWGLANESKKQNSIVKSSDLIGIRPFLITPDHVGCRIGQFVARETKRAGWDYRDTPEERAQKRWIDFVNLNGGDACFVNGPGSFTC